MTTKTLSREMTVMLAQISQALRNCAERDRNDIIANSASALAVRLEGVGSTFGMQIKDMTAVDRQIVQYALANHKGDLT